MKNQKYYGRKDINKLDWLFAIAWIIIALASLHICVGLGNARAGGSAIPAFADLLYGLAFLWKPKFGPVGLLVVNGIVFYAFLIYTIVASVYFTKKNKKERIPGVFASFVGALAFIVFLSLIYELTSGVSKGAIAGFWSYGAIVYLICLFFLVAFSLYATLTKYNISMDYPEEKQVEKVIVKEIVRVVEKQEEKPAVKEEKKEEPAPVVKPAPKKVVVEEEPSGFNGLGPRRKRIPFESKLKKVDHETYSRYSAIVEALREYNLNDRISVPGEAFSYKKERLVFITFSGNTLKVYMALNPKDFVESPIPMKDMSSVKKFEQTPCMLAVKSDLASRRVIECCKNVCQNYKVPKNKSKK